MNSNTLRGGCLLYAAALAWGGLMGCACQGLSAQVAASRPATSSRRTRAQSRPALKGPATGRWASGIAARVNRDVITVANVWEAIGRARLASLSPEDRKRLYDMTLDSLILKKINSQAVDAVKLTLSEFEKRSYIENRKEALGGEEAYQEWLNETDRTEQQFVQEFVGQFKRSYYLRSLAGAARALGPDVRPEHNVLPSAREIRAYYHRHLKDSFSVPAEVRLRFLSASHLICGGEKQARKAVRQARRDLESGADFVKVARRVMKSQAPSTGRIVVLGGGEEAPLPPPEEVERYALKAPVGTISPPIRYRRGYYLVAVEGRRPERVRPFNEVQFQIREHLKVVKTRQATLEVQRKLLERSYIYPKRLKQRLLGREGA